MTADAFWEFEREGWSHAAAAYEECWTDTSLFLEPLLDAAGVHAGSDLLDLACGPGFVSEAAAARGARPVGLDVAGPMVQRARERCPGLTFVEGDAQRLSFADASFDAVTMNFGILHLSKPEVALAETRRVLRPGGRLAFTAWVLEGNVADEIMEAALAAHARAAVRGAPPRRCPCLHGDAGPAAGATRGHPRCDRRGRRALRGRRRVHASDRRARCIGSDAERMSVRRRPPSARR
jgi:SAM-dependent methyltransferase